jgi:hypothetical protein
MLNKGFRTRDLQFHLDRTNSSGRKSGGQVRHHSVLLSQNGRVGLSRATNLEFHVSGRFKKNYRKKIRRRHFFRFLKKSFALIEKPSLFSAQNQYFLVQDDAKFYTSTKNVDFNDIHTYNNNALFALRAF